MSPSSPARVEPMSPLDLLHDEMRRQNADALASLDAACGQAKTIAERIRATGQLVMLGMGASHWVNRMVLGSYRALDIDAHAEVLSEALRIAPPARPRVMLLTSQSGGSGEARMWLGENRLADVFGLTLQADSVLGSAVPCLVGQGGRERPFAATRSVMVTLALHAAVLEALGMGTAELRHVWASRFEPDQWPPEKAVEALCRCGILVLASRGELQPALEGSALTYMELARTPAMALELGQLIHGPQEALGGQTALLLARPAGADAAGVTRFAQAAVWWGTPVVLVDMGAHHPAIDGASAITLPAASGLGRHCPSAACRTVPGHCGGCPACAEHGRATALVKGDRRRGGMSAPILVLGNVNVDLVMGPVDGWPAIGTEVEVERAEMRAGGSAGNTALALTGLREPHLLVASTGDDPNGVWLRGEFDPACCDWIDDPGMTTTTVGIVHKGGDRAFFTTPGHLQRATPEALMARAPVAPRRGAIALLSGNLLMPAIRNATATILAGLRERGWETAIDPGWPPQGWSTELQAMLGEWLSLTDHALLNEEEVAALAKGADMNALASALPPGATLVVKCGPAGAIAIRDGSRHTVPAPLVEVIDTVGAGDSFNAAYLAAVVSGASLPAALERGVKVASHAVSTFPRRYLP